MLPLIAGLGVGVLGAAAQYFGQREANQTNERIASNATQANMEEAARNRAFQAEQTSAQMAFQERMSSTAHQREMKDLAAAGLNPALTATGGAGSSTPGGAAASGDAGQAVGTRVENTFGGIQSAIQSAFQAAQIANTVELQEAQISNVRSQTAKNLVDAKVSEKGIPESEIKNSVFDLIRPYLRSLKESLGSSAKKSMGSSVAPKGNLKKYGITPNTMWMP